ncbi:MAG: chromosomal replication initiator protein DnaA, partial [Clostridia bacterium]|nr:chromosomal replication initiator protein DnaA [Clostridia bacterium]
MNETMDLHQLWENAQPIIKKSMTAMSYQLWIEGLEPLCVLNDALVFTYTGDMALDTLRNLYTAPVTSAIADTSGAAYRIVFVSSDEREKYLRLKEEESRREDTMLNPKFTFDSFVIGGSNNIAYAAAKAVADNPATAYNPLFIYGDVGLGKTHLMHAIGNHIKQIHPAYRITYVTSETFTNELIESIKDNANAQFRNKYRNVDVLMVDDVQFIAGKNTTQEEFFNTFNTLHTSGKQIIISSDKPPKEIPALEDRLRSRFEGGLITDIQSPDYETRIAILQKKAAQESIVVDEKVLALIASKVNANIRQLEGAFTRVVAFSRLTNTPVDVKMAEAALKDIVDSQERKITIELIQQVVAEFYNITVESLVSSRRTADITYPRQIAM